MFSALVCRLSLVTWHIQLLRLSGPQCGRSFPTYLRFHVITSGYCLRLTSGTYHVLPQFGSTLPARGPQVSPNSVCQYLLWMPRGWSGAEVMSPCGAVVEGNGGIFKPEQPPPTHTHTCLVSAEWSCCFTGLRWGSEEWPISEVVEMLVGGGQGTYSSRYCFVSLL